MLYLKANQHDERLTLEEARHFSAIKIKQASESRASHVQMFNQNAPELQWPSQLIKTQNSGHLDDAVFKSQLRHFRDARRHNARYDHALENQSANGKRQITDNKSGLSAADFYSRRAPAGGIHLL
ncbi:hypothetical protein QS257_15915 [Terrilactibacillus sp. S3-3]|nr:hypothetical protein QS257_15915 [Terrilactibacillus sp. S3-3]